MHLLSSGSLYHELPFMTGMGLRQGLPFIPRPEWGLPFTVKSGVWMPFTGGHSPRPTPSPAWRWCWCRGKHPWRSDGKASVVAVPQIQIFQRISRRRCDVARRPIAVVALWSRVGVDMSRSWRRLVQSRLVHPSVTVTNFPQQYVLRLSSWIGKSVSEFWRINLSSLVVIGYTKRKQVAVYLATNEKSRVKKSLHSVNPRVKHYSVRVT